MFDEQTTGIKVSRQTLYDKVWSTPMARFIQEAKQINGLYGPTNMQIGSTHSWPDSLNRASTLNPLPPKLG